MLKRLTAWFWRAADVFGKAGDIGALITFLGVPTGLAVVSGYLAASAVWALPAASVVFGFVTWGLYNGLLMRDRYGLFRAIETFQLQAIGASIDEQKNVTVQVGLPVVNTSGSHLFVSVKSIHVVIDGRTHSQDGNELTVEPAPGAAILIYLPRVDGLTRKPKYEGTVDVILDYGRLGSNAKYRLTYRAQIWFYLTFTDDLTKHHKDVKMTMKSYKHEKI